MKVLHRGAEAVLFETKDGLVKERRPKRYRLSNLDERLRSSRIRREVKVLETLADTDVPVPELYSEEDMSFTMERVDASLLHEALTEDVSRMRSVGTAVARMHECDVAHGDLTTSNILWDTGPVLIDFGLAMFSEKDEDKAVDLHVLRSSLTTQLGERGKQAFDQFKQGYTDGAVLERLKTVSDRGRYT